MQNFNNVPFENDMRNTTVIMFKNLSPQRLFNIIEWIRGVYKYKYRSRFTTKEKVAFI